MVPGCPGNGNGDAVEKAWLTIDEIAEVVAGEYWIGDEPRVRIRPRVAGEIARRVAKASMVKAQLLREKDPMTRAATDHDAWEAPPYDVVQLPISLEHVALIDKASPYLPWYRRLWNGVAK
jgi:hypothetical protein